MTTGRINQVTTFRPYTPRSATHDSHDNQVAFSFGSSSILVEDSIITSNSVLHCCLIAHLKPTIKTPYSPVSQILDSFLLVTSSNKDHGLRRELPTAGFITVNECSAAADSQVVKCNRFSYQQVIHILPHRKHLEVFDFQIG